MLAVSGQDPRFLLLASRLANRLCCTSHARFPFLYTRTDMQFHVSGYQTGDPLTMPAAGTVINRPAELPKEMDVLIVGCGPAGSITSAQLSRFPDVHTLIIEHCVHRLSLANSDVVLSRTMTTF